VSDLVIIEAAINGTTQKTVNWGGDRAPTHHELQPFWRRRG
jgi:hypothetical protein